MSETKIKFYGLSLGLLFLNNIKKVPFPFLIHQMVQFLCLAEANVGDSQDSLVRFSEIHIGGIDPSSANGSPLPAFKGSLQQVKFNGEEIFELARSGQLTNHQV